MGTQSEALSTTPSVQVVGNTFVEQYYHILHHSPDMVHKFYQDTSFISRLDEDGEMITVTTMKAVVLPLGIFEMNHVTGSGLSPIQVVERLMDLYQKRASLLPKGINEKICSLDYTSYKVEITTADTQESYKGGVVVLVTGFLTRKEDNQRKKFIQSFFLAPQDKGFFVLNDVFRYVDEIKPTDDHHVVVEAVDDNQKTSLIPDPPLPDLAKVHKEEAQSVEKDGPDVLENVVPLSDENNSVEPEPDPSENNISLVAESKSTAMEDAPKMSYASILNSQTKKGRPGPTKVYVPANNSKETSTKTENKSVVSVARGPPPEVPAPIASSSITSPDSSNVHHEAIGDGYSIYIRNLPLNATVNQLETEFKNFGPIKPGGIQVRSNKLGFCFGFIEFQDVSSMQKAIQSSPVVVDGKEVIVEIKRTTTRVGGGRGRFPVGRGGFRSDIFRPRGGAFNGGRGYGRSDYGGGRGDFSGRGRGYPGGPGEAPYHQQGRGRSGGGRRGGSVQYTNSMSTST